MTPRRPRGRSPWASGRAVAALSAVAGLLVGAGAMGWAGHHYRLYAVAGSSMEPSLDPDALMLVELLGPDDRAGVGRGDVVVFPDPGTWADHGARTALGASEHGTATAPTSAGRPAPATVVKRVVALPGERVVCCSSQGRLLVDGQELVEPYLHASGGRFASALAFDTVVPEGTVWVLGDHRAVSRDSRFDPTGENRGAIRVSDLIGVVRAAL